MPQRPVDGAISLSQFYQPRSLIRSCVRVQDDAKPDLFEADRHIFSIPNVPQTSRSPSAATRPRRNFTTNAVRGANRMVTVASRYQTKVSNDAC